MLLNKQISHEFKVKKKKIFGIINNNVFKFEFDLIVLN